MGIKDAIKKIKPQEQSCCSVEIKESKDTKQEKDEKKENNKSC
ncbi:alcohol dehydrogenase [Staphylococcus pseudoxylosus]|nr:alcohol dehydrogenase [Staphylococcus pseudoxylosus]PTI43943.1 alcohol dehydrogenase [Staphylococcus xylosus]MDW8799358.1 alcohol dehydrogenase [Staphylococcus pseudoxylosus]MEB6037402.1 alcohol dehydrogenase [Staphylococcus pseudoxylosus]MEB6045826.1 alcohol dehydrogenase [Staphylococcus pseudoxylosus]MEB7764113.1 alcohol dehydrogenase [Staphylococcus pseudoxylosus]